MVHLGSYLNMTRLRAKIEEIGGDVLSKIYGQQTSERPKIIPPIPDSKHFEKLSDGDLKGRTASLKELQDGYEAEVKVYRCFEELRRDVIVVHQIEYTKEQYSVFDPFYKFDKKTKFNIFGETDFVVIGNCFVAVFEVKGLTISKHRACSSEQSSEHDMNAVRFEKCCEDAGRQRNRMVNLVNKVDSSVPVYQFTVFPNISREDIDRGYLSDTSLLFSEDMDNFTSKFDTLIPPHDTARCSDKETVKRYLVGLWCIKNNNHWDVKDCTLSRCIVDVNEKLKRALVTKSAVDLDKAKHGKNKKKKQEKSPENPRMVNAPDLFKDYLNISCLTQDQQGVFKNDEKLLWVEGPAGSGKTIAMLGKIIDIVLNPNLQGRSRVLVVSAGQDDLVTIKRNCDLLNSICESVTCTIVTYNYSNVRGDIRNKVDEAESDTFKQFVNCKSQIVLLAMNKTLINQFVKKILFSFNYVFVDDYQLITDQLLRDAPIYPTYTQDILSYGLMPVVQYCVENNTTVWVLSDMGQSWYQQILKELPAFQNIVDEFRNMFVSKMYFSVNVRNAYELSTVLSVIREHNSALDCTDTGRLGLPQQQDGHFLRGTKPTIYLLDGLRLSNSWELGILNDELCKLKEPDSCLENKDIAVLCNFVERRLIEKVSRVLEIYKEENNKITLQHTAGCMSAEWAAVVVLYRCEPVIKNTVRDRLPNIGIREISYSVTFPQIYVALSRARVYSTVIMFDYTPNSCEDTDKLLFELRKRKDVCRIIEV